MTDLTACLRAAATVLLEDVTTDEERRIIPPYP